MTAMMPATVKNQMLIDSCQEVVYERYAAPTEEVTVVRNRATQDTF